MIYGLVWGALAVGWFVMGRVQAKHKARMDAHDREFAKYEWATPINARGPLFDYICAAVYAIVAATYFAQELFS